MNNNSRGVRATSEKDSHKSSALGTRHSSIAAPNNNIHININLNVKKKSHCYHPETIQGKKINNFFELSDLKSELKPEIKHPQIHPIEEHQTTVKSTAVGKQKFLLAKPDSIKVQQKTKKKKTKDKQKTASKPFTPQKHFKPQSEEKSLEKSRTNKKLQKKKQSKSMQNIKIFKQKPLHLQQTKPNFHENKNPTQETKKSTHLIHPKDKHKIKSRSNSSSKQRSRERSSQKLKKVRSSSKNIASFQNSGIKKILASQKQSGTKNQALQNIRKSKKSLRVSKIAERDMIKINEFMEEKKKQEEKKKKQGEQSSKGIKIKDEIMKQSKKEFYTKPQKPTISHSVSEYKKKSKFPMFYGEEEQNNQENDSKGYVNYTKSRPEHRTPERSRPYSKQVSPDINKKSSSKKPRVCLVQKYINGDITKPEKKELKKKVIVIQAFWRGYQLRKNLMQELAKITKATSHKKRLIDQKKSDFWDDDGNNSIINLDEDEKSEQQVRQVPSYKGKQNKNEANPYKTPENSNYNSSETPTEENHTNKKKYESQSGHENEFLENESHEQHIRANEFKKLYQKHENTKKNLQNRESPSPELIANNNSQLSSQIELLKRQIEEQNKKFLQLEQENTELRQNLKSIVVQKQKEKEKEQHHKIVPSKTDKNNFETQSSHSNSQPISPIDIEDDLVIYELNRAQFVSGSSLQRVDVKEAKEDSKKSHLNNGQKFKSLKIQTGNQLPQQFTTKPTLHSSAQSPSNPYLQNLKRQLQSFESPSNRSLKSAELSNLKGLQKAFKKKELSIDANYEKNAIMYQQMLQNNLVSPRTYSFKKVQLEEKYKKQKEEINQKYHEAEKVIKYISDEIVEQEKIGEDQSPQKLKKGEHFSEQLKHEAKKQNNEAKKPQKKLSEVKELIKSELEKQIDSYNGQENSISQSNESGQSNFRKYWTDDLEEVHKKVLQISSKIDEALESDSKYSESIDSNREYSSQNSNFQSLKSNHEQEPAAQQKKKDPPGDQMASPIFQQTEYKISEPAQMESQKTETNQEEEVMANNSNVSSTSSGRNLEVYNIHYPSSPKSQKAESQGNKHNFEVRHENYEEGENSIEGNNSQLSQNRSSLSEASLKSSTKPSSLKGFDTRLTFIKEYCIALCEFIRSEEELKQSFISNISTPLRYDYFEMLKSYRTTTVDQNDTKYNSTLEDYMYPYFKMVKGSLGERGLNFKNTSKFQELYEQNYNVSKELTVEMREVRKYFIQAIIDVFNESLDFERPGSVYGEPLPWLVQSKNLKNNQVKFLNEPEPIKRRKASNGSHIQESDQNQSAEQDQRLDKIFGVAIAKIIQWGSCLCGFIPEPVSFDGEDAQAVNIDDDQTNLVRETRLAYMLEKSLAEDEEKMVDNTMEQLEVMLEIQQMVVYDMVTEFADEFHRISKK